MPDLDVIRCTYGYGCDEKFPREIPVPSLSFLAHENVRSSETMPLVIEYRGRGRKRLANHAHKVRSGHRIEKEPLQLISTRVSLVNNKVSRRSA
jgi:hypothetical protein